MSATVRRRVVPLLSLLALLAAMAPARADDPVNTIFSEGLCKAMTVRADSVPSQPHRKTLKGVTGPDDCVLHAFRPGGNFAGTNFEHVLGTGRGEFEAGMSTDDVDRVFCGTGTLVESAHMAAPSVTVFVPGFDDESFRGPDTVTVTRVGASPGPGRAVKFAFATVGTQAHNLGQVVGVAAIFRQPATLCQDGIVLTEGMLVLGDPNVVALLQGLGL